MRIGPGKPAEISALAHTDTGNEKSHRMIPRERGAHQNQHSGRGHRLYNLHIELLNLLVRRAIGP